MTDWFIISPGTGEGFQAKPENELLETDYVVARHPDESSALEGIQRASSVEKQLRPMWAAAIEHELKLRNYMLDTSHAAARRTPKIMTEGEPE